MTLLVLCYVTAATSDLGYAIIADRNNRVRDRFFSLAWAL